MESRGQGGPGAPPPAPPGPPELAFLCSHPVMYCRRSFRPFRSPSRSAYFGRIRCRLRNRGTE
jgi:hypothetical protein